jgi:serine/threonine-protein kinase RsbT
MTGSDPETQAIAADEDVVRVRQLVRKLAVAAKLSLVDQTKLVTGIADLDLALSDGYTSGGGLGLGLGGARRLVDEFDIQTVPAEGTTITVTKWAR